MLLDESEPLTSRLLLPFWHFLVPLDEALVQVALDRSGRPRLEFDLQCTPNALAFARTLPMATKGTHGAPGRCPAPRACWSRREVVEGCVGLGMKYWSCSLMASRLPDGATITR